MEQHGVPHEQVAQVRGFAERQLRHPEDPMHASNRRVSVIVQYLRPPAEPVKLAGEGAKGESARVPNEAEKKSGESHKEGGEAAKGEGGRPPAH